MTRDEIMAAAGEGKITISEARHRLTQAEMDTGAEYNYAYINASTMSNVFKHSPAYDPNQDRIVMTEK